LKKRIRRKPNQSQREEERGMKIPCQKWASGENNALNVGTEILEGKAAGDISSECEGMAGREDLRLGRSK